MADYMMNLVTLKNLAIKEISLSYKCDFSSLGLENFEFFVGDHKIKGEDEELSLAMLVANVISREFINLRFRRRKKR